MKILYLNYLLIALSFLGYVSCSAGDPDKITQSQSRNNPNDPGGGNYSSAAGSSTGNSSSINGSLSASSADILPNAPVVSGTSPTLNKMPTWNWVSGGGGSGTYRYKLDSSDLTAGAVEAAAVSFTPASALSLDNHTLYVQERNSSGNWSVSGNYTILISDCIPVGWIGGGSDGWKTNSDPISGGDYRSFRYPGDVFVDSAGNIYISDSITNRISKWDSSGTALGCIGGGSDGWKTGNSPISAGTDLRSFKNPEGVFVDNSGNIYVADYNNHRISKWDSSGTALGWIGGGYDGWQTGSAPGAAGNFKYFSGPSSVCVDGSGNIYVVDCGYVSKWSSNGVEVGWIGGGSDGWQTGMHPGTNTDYRSFSYAHGICIDGSGNLYVTEDYNNRISKWDSSGTALGWIGGGSDGWKQTDGAVSNVDYRSFRLPRDVSVDAGGNIYVADWYNNRISKWNSSGTALGWIGYGSPGWKKNDIPSTYSGTIRDYDFFNYPIGIFVWNSTNIYIAEQNNYRISKWQQP